MEWDIFISHASEDKVTIVRDLSNELKKYGVRVWYDEFELKIGDSLIESINNGLSQSNHGALILSHSFFEKTWTDYELKSLITKEMFDKKKILPIWYNIDKDYLMSKSLFLADKFALNSSDGVKKIALEIVKIVRPDIVNSFVAKAALQKMLAEKKYTLEKVKASDLRARDAIIHKSLPKHLVIATSLICKLSDILDEQTMLENFAKDLDYDKEFIIFNILACAFVETILNSPMDIKDSELRKQCWHYLINISLGNEQGCEKSQLDSTIKSELLKNYCSNYENIMKIDTI